MWSCYMYYVVVIYGFFFFFKQKTAYEMRISDWSSDVCSSDLIDADDANPSIGKINRIPIDDPGTWRRQSCFRDFDERLLVLRDCIGCHDKERRPHRPSLEPRRSRKQFHSERISRSRSFQSPAWGGGLTTSWRPLAARCGVARSLARAASAPCWL